MQSNKKQLKISILMHSLAAIVLLSLLILASFKDLEISIAIGDQKSFFGLLFMIIAEYPQYLIMPITSVIIFYNYPNFELKWQKYSVMILGVILSLVGWFILFYCSAKLSVIPHLLGFSIFFSIVLTAIFFAIGRCISQDFMTKLLKWALFALCVAAISLAAVQILKVIWHRMRYRDMLTQGDFDGFTPWYVVNSFRGKLDPSYHYSSFPSGHTTAAVNIFVIVPLCDIFGKKLWVKYLTNGLCAIFVFLTMWARIVNCAHFLSDVVVATILTYVIYYATKYVFFGKGKFVFERSNTATTDVT